MSKKLLIVESPAKSKTIQKYVGQDYSILASYGHVRDLSKENKFGVDIENNFSPSYIILDDKKKVVKALKDQSKKVDEILIATDPDREGEAIAWHVIEALKLDLKKTKRVVFNEITKNAVLHAISHPRDINYNLVNAQQARRILDRIVGFELSPILWKKVKTGLSAGRVQSVALRLVVERDREISQFTSESYYKVIAHLKTKDNIHFQAEADTKYDSKDSAIALLESLKNNTFIVNDIEKKPAKRNPSPPFTTATLQQEAYRKLGYSVAQTMSVAQRLYEAGLITYMRTDSISLSQDALKSINRYVIDKYGQSYAELRHFKTKTKGAQEAHEAIRPTLISTVYNGNNSQEERLYELIQKRSLASQMASAKIDRTIVTLMPSQADVNFIAKGEVITFDGFLKVYFESSDDDDSPANKETQGLPALSVNQVINYNSIIATERFLRPPARYTEASLVKKLEELGIGRPSTYAPTISTIMKRNYVEKGELLGTERSFNTLILENKDISEQDDTEMTGSEKGKLIPTDIGKVVNDYLVDSFSGIMDYQFTAIVEEKFDAIAEGTMKWQEMLADFYAGFHPNIEKAEETKGRVSGERELGQDPESGRLLIVRIGKYGPIAQIGNTEDDEKPKFASLLKTQSLETITLEEALELFKYPRQLGLFEEFPVEAAIGRFGPYVKHNNAFYSIKDYPIDEITIDQAIEVINLKRELDKKKFIKTIDDHDPPIVIQKGPYGPYFKIGKKNFKIPKDQDPEKLTLEDCLEIQKNPPKRSFRKRKKK